MIDVELIFHQHHQEFNNDNNDAAFAYLLREISELKVELDVGWFKYVDADILDNMKKYHDRIAIVHLKDIVENAIKQESKDIFTAIGESSIPLKEIIEESKNIESQYTKLIIDQDASIGDMLKELEVGYNNIQKAYNN